MSDKTNGMLHIYTGDGKGKTTAAIGLAVRFAGSGQRVLYTQFLKRNDSSELRILEQIEKIELLRCERCFGFTSQMSEGTKKEAESFYTAHLHRLVQEIWEKADTKNSYGLLIMDELATAYAAGVVDKKAVLELLRKRPDDLELVITGRNAAPELLAYADYVSEIKKCRHPYDNGVAARLGIEL